MSRPAWATTALLACGVLLLCATQPWVRTVTELAPGAPRSRSDVGASVLVPWLAPVALVTGLAVAAGLSGLRWARPVAVLAAGAALAGAVTGVVGGIGSTGPVTAPGPVVVEASPTGWLWAGAAAAALTLVGILRWVWPAPTAPRRSHDAVRGWREDAPGGGPTDHDGAEARRRHDARTWDELSEGRDPTEP